MKHSRTEVRRWRMLRQQQQQKSCWMNAQLRRNKRIFAMTKYTKTRQRTVLLSISHR